MGRSRVRCDSLEGGRRNSLAGRSRPQRSNENQKDALSSAKLGDEKNKENKKINPKSSPIRRGPSVGQQSTGRETKRTTSKEDVQSNERKQSTSENQKTRFRAQSWETKKIK